MSYALRLWVQGKGGRAFMRFTIASDVVCYWSLSTEFGVNIPEPSRLECELGLSALWLFDACLLAPWKMCIASQPGSHVLSSGPRLFYYAIVPSLPRRPPLALSFIVICIWACS